MDTGNNACANQATFNSAVYNAVKYCEKKDKAPTWVVVVTAIIMAIFLGWAIILALKIGATTSRETSILHVVLAVLFSPIYILSYYLGGGTTEF